MAKRLIVGYGLVVAMAFLLGSLAPAADAHSELASSTPANGAIVAEPITEIEFVFTTGVQPFVDGFAVTTHDGVELDVAEVRQARPESVVVVLDEPVTIAVTARWATVSADTHPVTGTISFAVELPAAPEPTPSTVATPTPSPSPTPTLVDAATVPTAVATDVQATPEPTEPPATPSVATPSSIDREVASDLEAVTSSAPSFGPSTTTQVATHALRSTVYVSSLAVVGALSMWRALRRSTGLDSWNAMRRFVGAAALILAVSSPLLLGSGAATLSGRLRSLWQPSAWDPLLSTQAVTGTTLRTGGAVALLLLAVNTPNLRSRAVQLVGLAATAAIVVSFGPLGHTSRLLAPIHAASVAVWAGGLLTTVVLVTRRVEVPAAIARFSRLAGPALLVAVVTGIGLTIIQLDQFSDLWATTFGKRLLLKVALVGCAAVLGAIQRFNIIVALASHTGRSTLRFVRVSKLELALMGLAAIATARLVAAA